MLDLLIKNGTVVDGTGAPAFTADIAVQGGVICEIGVISAPAAQVFDAAGMHVTPGFIDLHTHSDLGLILDGRAESFLCQGVTTETTGNCGFSAAPLQGGAQLARNCLCYVPPPHPPAWGSMNAYLARLQESLSINTVSLVGHGTLRSCVMGYENRPATQREIDRMCSLLDDCLAEGAAGLSTGLEYFPGNAAAEAELIALCRVAARRGALYATHLRNRDKHYKQGFAEALSAARQSGVRLQISHAVPKYGVPQGGAEDILATVTAAAKDIDVAFDVIPYIWGPTALAAVLPPKLAQLPWQQLVGELATPSVRTALKTRTDFIWQMIPDGRWDDIKLYDSVNCAQWHGLTLRQIAEETGTTPFDAMLDILCAEREHLFSTRIMGKIKAQQDLDLLIQSPLCGVISDAVSLTGGGALGAVHWSPGSHAWVPQLFQSFVCHRKILSLENAVSKITRFPARRLGLRGRGLLAVGQTADIAAMSLARFAETPQTDSLCRGTFLLLMQGRPVLQSGQIVRTGQGCALRHTASNAPNPNL